MPRVGGVYSPPAGTKGVPNTTIQSAPYNALVDDLSLDANNPRPITAGGTGASTASGARAALGTDNADNLTSGTVADARLPATQTGKTFTGAVVIKNASDRILAFQDAAGVVRGRLVHGAVPSTIFHQLYDAAGTFLKQLQLPPTGSMTWDGQTIWTSGNDGAGSGLDADLLDGQEGAFYQNAANLTGTIPDARLPSTMSAKTFTGNVLLTGGDYFVDNSSGDRRLVLRTAAGVIQGAFGNTLSTGANFINVHDAAGTFLRNLVMPRTGSMTWAGDTVWTAGNDGAGSGLDADLLDGQQGAYFADIPSRLGFTPLQQGGGGGQGTNKIYIGWLGSQLGVQIDASNQSANWPINITGTINGIASSSIAQIVNTTNANEINFPVGWTIALIASSGISRNGGCTPCLFTGDSQAYVNLGDSGAGSALPGTWRASGRYSSGLYAVTKIF
ncbi:hypothetical protein [Pararhizobium sp. DWP1-1-3]|uniref:hypothetical protein n=1 Tax=Pararhizobium sp. DWP1-1-3 TaxID=2804652 RepID=UPI003CECF0F4